MKAKKTQTAEGRGDASAAIKKPSADGPRAPKPKGRSAPREASAAGPFGGGYTDSGYVGWRDERKTFETAAGRPSPRLRAQRGERGFGEHVGPERSEELIRKAAPLT
jgi:hypothetical protein